MNAEAVQAVAEAIWTLHDGAYLADQAGADEALELARVAVEAARPAIERETKAVAVESLREFARAQDTWCEAGRAEQVITRAAMRDALLREADDLEAGQ